MKQGRNAGNKSRDMCQVFLTRNGQQLSKQLKRSLKVSMVSNSIEIETNDEPRTIEWTEFVDMNGIFDLNSIIGKRENKDTLLMKFLYHFFPTIIGYDKMEGNKMLNKHQWLVDSIQWGVFVFYCRKQLWPMVIQSKHYCKSGNEYIQHWWYANTEWW